MIKAVILFGIFLLFAGCSHNEVIDPDNSQNQEHKCKQELSKAKDWMASWKTCAGDGAIKKDGTLWQLGEVGGCNWGQMLPPLDPDTGKPTYTTKYIYHLEPKKIGDGFAGAKIINGGYRVYAIKKDGTLWGWGEGLRKKPLLLSYSHDWVDFGVKWAGNGCCDHDIGLKKDGSLWILPEDLNYAHKSPLPDLKRVGKQKGWDRVILNCCSMYAMKKDGSLWVNRDRLKGLKFVKFDPKVDCNTGEASFCKNLRSAFSKMPSQSIYNYYSNYDEMKSQKVKVGGSAGTLCIIPETVYKF
ncbi:hypothetical protein [Sulfurovum sp. NBC37-1]|uniref:hypothetical protein n=1 Tax=Sulfurovum sp. (strain NBC37-1) TaxID=387093 RepID=UPI00015879B4|nr:hypothetical protein [Sulfurovum sp. NBC37-1]BAF72966.1 hypothetical protein SUN_2024 [Sulfurovum sp. NBC37-1]